MNTTNFLDSVPLSFPHVIAALFVYAQLWFFFKMTKDTASYFVMGLTVIYATSVTTILYSINALMTNGPDFSVEFWILLALIYIVSLICYVIMNVVLMSRLKRHTEPESEDARIQKINGILLAITVVLLFFLTGISDLLASI